MSSRQHYLSNLLVRVKYWTMVHIKHSPKFITINYSVNKIWKYTKKVGSVGMKMINCLNIIPILILIQSQSYLTELIFGLSQESDDEHKSVFCYLLTYFVSSIYLSRSFEFINVTNFKYMMIVSTGWTLIYWTNLRQTYIFYMKIILETVKLWYLHIIVKKSYKSTLVLYFSPIS